MITRHHNVLIALLLLLLTTTHVMATSLKVHIVTYNTGNTRPRESIAPLLGLGLDPDIISLGFQELGDTDDWENEADRILSKQGYYRIKLVTMSIMQIAVFAKKQHLPFISHIQTEYTKTGFGGTYGNKGGTSVRFRLYDKTVAMVNTHLSAHMDQVHIRDEEYWNIMSEQDFDDPLSEHLYDHDYLFWSGDLNYRIQLGNDEVRAAITNGKHLDLMEHDQLRQEKLAGHAFIGFHEADITFKPTYKFDPETDIYDTSEKNRVPAWCDRVLWRIKAERAEIAHALNWDGEGDSSDSSLSSWTFSGLSDASGASGSDLSDHCEVDGGCTSKQYLEVTKPEKKKKKKKKKKKQSGTRDDNAHSDRSNWEAMRKRTISLMKKTAVYAASTGSAMLRTATGTAPIKIHKADVADPERFKDLMNTLEREKVAEVKEKYENCVRPLVYKSYPEYKQSDHKPVSALLEVGVNTNMKPLISFGQDKYVWKKGDKLDVLIDVRSRVWSLSSWDWVAIVDPNWTDPHKHYITYQYITKDTAKFGWETHPGVAKTLNLVLNSSKMSAPIAIAVLECL
ncbi:uncharacterized protein LOC134822908 isoform X2 [Bolinopsis microptera]|uniref:uncharacterized protein LOC134822908 isoform X2 n=1 Tax=Bolinopsis microptera TaxID=2820187 RepID=UPI00307AA7DC